MIQVSFVNPLGTMIVVHSITFDAVSAGTSNAGPRTTMSGLITHPSSGHTTGGGASFESPSMAPPSTHLTMVSSSAAFSERSVAYSTPYCGSACQGGISRAATFALIERAHGRASA